MRLRLAALAFVALVGGAGEGWADGYTPIPQYDVDKGCALADTPEGVKSCIKLEQDSYDFIKSIWPRVSEIVRKDCITSADNLQQYQQKVAKEENKNYVPSFYYVGIAMSLREDIAHPRADLLPDHFKP